MSMFLVDNNFEQTPIRRNKNIVLRLNDVKWCKKKPKTKPYIAMEYLFLSVLLVTSEPMVCHSWYDSIITHFCYCKDSVLSSVISIKRARANFSKTIKVEVFHVSENVALGTRLKRHEKRCCAISYPEPLGTRLVCYDCFVYQKISQTARNLTHDIS